jgi:DNA mismatch repair protein MutS
MDATTPLMKQYQEIKDSYKDALLLFQMGDFFECFFDDAVKISETLGIVLTSREKKENAAQMAGFPLKALDDYLPKLIAKGFKVAIARQTENPQTAKGIVKRAVTEVITQGTIASQENLLSDKKNYLLCYITKGTRMSIAVSDVTTGELKVWEAPFSEEILQNVIERLNPKEILKSTKDDFTPEKYGNAVIQPLPQELFNFEAAERTLINHFNIPNLDPLGLQNHHEGVITTGVILNYIIDTKKTDPKHITSVVLWDPNEALIIDTTTQRNLDIFLNNRSHEGEGSLFYTIDETLTPMGRRNLFDWMSFPLTSETRINERLDTVEYFIKDQSLLKNVREELKSITDVERITSLIGLSRVHPKQLLQLKKSIESAIRITEILNTEELPVLVQNLINELDLSKLNELKTLIENTLADDIADGNTLFKYGYNSKLDELLTLTKEGHSLIKKIFETEKEKSEIQNMKLGYNRVFGYYFEISKANAKFAPEHFIKKQTLTNGERFITEEVKNLEVKLISAQDDLVELETRLYNEFVFAIQGYISYLKPLIVFVSHLDTLTAFAYLAIHNNYSRPAIALNQEGVYVKNARHAVVEKKVKSFVPNNYSFEKSRNFIILTGPNMGGKSTYVRQIALIQILAQIGSFVPAEEACLEIVDKIFARIGASDDISSGRSTFMVEISEVANIVKNATPQSLVILDEVGRGTSTYEGISLAWGISLFIANKIKCKTVFTTHFRELTELENEDKRFMNLKVNILEEGGNIYFLHTIAPGISDKSYGIQVAKLVNLPEEIISTALSVLDTLEKNNKDTPKRINRRHVPDQQQLNLFAAPQEDPKTKSIIARIKDIDLNTMSPIDVVVFMNELKKDLSN